MARQSFKSDESFLEKISLGAIGARKVFSKLQSFGHHPIELERGSMSYKIWKNIKIKRFRIPDILCVNCGKKFESRAKKDFELSMSHSPQNPERAWDVGLDDDDYVAFIACYKNGSEPIDWQAEDLVQFIHVRDMREAFRENKYLMPDAKGVEEGSETRIVFPSVVTNSEGVIESITDTSIKFRPTGGRLIPYRLRKTKNGKVIPLNATVVEGQNVIKNQIIAGVFTAKIVLPCTCQATEASYLKMLHHPMPQQQYAAAKALAQFRSEQVIHELEEIITQRKAHFYVLLESSATLARWNNPKAWAFIQECLNDTFAANRLETVIILSEIQNDEACRLLCDVLQDNEQNPDVRAGAAWGLGELNNEKSLSVLINSFNNINENIRVEAARALARLTRLFKTQVINAFPKVNETERPGIAWAISQAGEFSIQDLIPTLIDLDTRQWAAYIIGNQKQEELIGQIEQIRTKDPELYFAITVLWKILSSWINDLEEY